MNTTPIRPLILVVDDEIQIRRLLRLSLDAAGYDVVEAETGELALVGAVARKPAAILLDLGLPDMSGVEVVRKLREWSKVPVLVVTILAN